MKHASVFVAAVAATFTALPALAQETAAPAGVFVDAQTQDQYLARDHLIGAKVTGPDGTIVGDIEDLIVNDSNQVVGVVMGTGGYFGIAEKKIGVNLTALKFDEKDGKMTVSLPEATAENIAAAPDFKRSQPPKSLFERAKEKVHELSDKTTATTQEAYEKAKPAIDDAAAKAKEALDKAKEAAAPVIEKAKEAAEGAVEKAKDAVHEATKPEEPATETPPGGTSEAAPPAEAPAAPEATTEPPPPQ